MAAPTLVAASVVTGAGTSHVTPSLSLQAGDVVTVIAIGEGASTGNNFTGCTTTFANGGVTALKSNTAASNCDGGSWTFTVSATGSGTVTVTDSASENFELLVVAHRGGTAATATRAAVAASSSRTLAYTPSQADSAIVWVVGDWAAAAVTGNTPTSTTHSSASPGPSALPANAVVGTNFTYYDAILDDQASTGSVSYGITGTGTGPFTIIVVEVQGTGGGGSTPQPFHPRATSRTPIFRASTF